MICGAINFFKFSILFVLGFSSLAYGQSLLQVFGGDSDGDGIGDGSDNCPYVANADQMDTGGMGNNNRPDGIGNACQCGDVNNDGKVTKQDKFMLQQALTKLPPYANGVSGLPAPQKCDVNLVNDGDAIFRCGQSDYDLIKRALKKKKRKMLLSMCAPPRFVIQGDTQSLAFYYTASGLPNEWLDIQHAICAAKTKLSIQAVIGTGDIVYHMHRPIEFTNADLAYDILDSCNLRQMLPAGNHDISIGNKPPYDFSYYLNFLGLRPLHLPDSISPGGASFTFPMTNEYWLLVFPWVTSTEDLAWARDVISNAPPERKFWLFQHDGVQPNSVQSPNGGLRVNSAIDQIAQQFSSSRIFGFMGGHYITQDRAEFWKLPSNQLALFSNFQESDYNYIDPTRFFNPYYLPFREMTMLEYFPLTKQWCAWDYNIMTGVIGRFQTKTCLTVP